jgi:predicted esterase
MAIALQPERAPASTARALGRPLAWLLALLAASGVLGTLARAEEGVAQLQPSARLPPALPASQSAPMPDDAWDAARADRLERELDAFMASSSDIDRHERYNKILVPDKVGLAYDELDAMSKPPAIALGKPARLSLDGQQGDQGGRGWFNLELPADYTPAHAWRLVVALHGSDSDGGNLVPFYSPRLAAGGAIVLYPTTSDKNHMWDDPAEMALVFRLIEWVGHRYRVDFRRLVMSGASMGGMGTWSHLLAYPELWSAGASVAGHPAAMGGDVLERLRGIPFYILHGGNDTNGASLAPVEHVRQAVAELKARGMDPVYVEVPGAGHTPPMDAWVTMIDWIDKQGPKAWSVRPQFLPTAPDRPLSEVELDPLGLGSDDPALALIRAGKFKDAIRLLSTRIAGTHRRLDYLYRALAYVPGVQEPFTKDVAAASFVPARGWGRANEAKALADLNAALHMEPKAQPQFITTAYLWAARIHAKQVLCSMGGDGSAWVDPWNAFVSNVHACMVADPANRDGAMLALIMQAHLPRSLAPPGAVGPDDPAGLRPPPTSGMGLGN